MLWLTIFFYDGEIMLYVKLVSCLCVSLQHPGVRAALYLLYYGVVTISKDSGPLIYSWTVLLFRR